jgi:hypothetical protein
LVEIDLATESDWIASGKIPAKMVDAVFRRFLHDHGHEIIGLDPNGPKLPKRATWRVL